MLDYKEFQQFVENHLGECLALELKDAKVEIHEVQKNNGLVLTGVTVLPVGQNIAPTIYLEEYYERYKNGRALYDILGDISTVAYTHMKPQGFESVGMDFRNFDYVKDKVVMVAVNRERNEELLRDVPHHYKEDLALIYKVLVSKEPTEMATITIRNEHMDLWGVSESDLYELAMNNTKELLPVKVQTMKELLFEQIIKDGLDPEVMEAAFSMADTREEMYVISNTARINGAAAVMYEGVLSDIAEELGTDLYILPSSVHECIAVSVEVADVDELTEMVASVNEEMVSNEEILSDNVYYFNAKEKTLTLANTSVEELGLKAAENGKSYGENQTNTEATRPRRHR